MRRGFTLIELLIVVAIIGILAAIAVPNFLNAQTRATIARVQSEFKTISTAMESYRIDNNTYPGDQDLDNWTVERGMFRLTSPIAYLANTFPDPFIKKHAKGTGSNAYASNYFPSYEMGSGADNSPATRKQAYSVVSQGPDLDDDIGAHDGFPFGIQMAPYDGSNGLKSNGDLHFYTGDFKSGCIKTNRLDPNNQWTGGGC